MGRQEMVSTSRHVWWGGGGVFVFVFFVCAQVVLSTETDVVEIFVYGAHVASWKHKNEVKGAV